MLVTNIPLVSKAERTRARLQQTAVELFSEHGFEQTTVAQIASAAGVSQMTFFRHFPTKESAVLDDPFDPAIAAAIAAQPLELTPVRRICAGLRVAIASLDLPDQEQVRTRVRVATTSSTLQAGMWTNTVATQRVVADALEADGVPRLQARVAAAATIAGLTAALQDWSLDDGGEPLADRLGAVLDLLDPEGA
jgi:AcrR family transcriptional regulator